MTTGRINQVDPHSELRRSSAFEGRGSHRRKYGSGDPEAAFQSKCRQGTKSRQGALFWLKRAQGSVRLPGPFELLSQAIFTDSPRSEDTTQIKVHRRRKVSRRRYFTEPSRRGGCPPHLLGRVCSANPVYWFTVRCPGGTRATRLGPSRRSHEPRSHPVISVTPKVP